MNLFLFIFINPSFSIYQKEIKNNHLPNLALYPTKSQIRSFSEQGFYNISITGDDELHISLNNGQQHLYFLIPYSPDFYIKELTIDGISVSINQQPIGLYIDGKDNTTLTFWSNKINYEHQINFWIISSNLCTNSSAFVFGTNIIEFKANIHEICVFSPIFDSDNQKFEIETGVSLQYSHNVSIYTKNYSNPYSVTYDIEIHSQTLKTANLVKFYIFEKVDKNFVSVFYRRKTSAKKSSYHQNICEADAFAHCTSFGCGLTEIKFDSVKCNDYDYENIFVAVIVVGLLIAITIIVIVCVCLIRRNRKKKFDVLVNSEPLNTIHEDENYITSNANYGHDLQGTSPIPEVIHMQ